MYEESVDLDDFDFVYNYDFIKKNYPKSWQLLFLLSIYYDKFKFKLYLKEFLQEKEMSHFMYWTSILLGNKIHV
jgi:hypothetical protein